MRAHVAFIGIAAICAARVYGGEPSFEFAGFTATTQLGDVRARYPKSQATESYIIVAAEESTDHIHGIGITKWQVGLIFERKDADGTLHYPLCNDVFNRIYRSYGGPNVVQNFHEERMKVQRRIWTRGHDRMALRCFWREGVVYAERVELYQATDSAP